MTQRGCSETIGASLPFNFTRICPMLMSREKLTFGQRSPQRIRTFPSTPPKPVNAPDGCPGPFLHSPLVPSVISTPGRWHSTVGNIRLSMAVAMSMWGPEPNSQSHQFTLLHTDAVNAADWQQIGHLRLTSRDPAQV